MVHDHDAKYGGGSDLVFQAEGIEVIRTPIAAPKANSHIERQIGSTWRECHDWILIFNRGHLERVLGEWFAHYNTARPHRALGLQPPIAREHGRKGGLLRATRRAVARVRAGATSGCCLNPDEPLYIRLVAWFSAARPRCSSFWAPALET